MLVKANLILQVAGGFDIGTIKQIKAVLLLFCPLREDLEKGVVVVGGHSTELLVFDVY